MMLRVFQKAAPSTEEAGQRRRRAMGIGEDLRHAGDHQQRANRGDANGIQQHADRAAAGRTGVAGAQTQRKIAKEIVDAADYHPEQKDFTVHPASP